MKQSNLALRAEPAEERIENTAAAAAAAPATERRPTPRLSWDAHRAIGRRTIVIRDQGLRPFRVL